MPIKRLFGFVRRIGKAAMKPFQRWEEGLKRDEPYERLKRSWGFGKELFISDEVINEDKIREDIKTARGWLTKRGTDSSGGEASSRLANWLRSTTIEPIARNRDSGNFRFLIIDNKGRIIFSNNKNRESSLNRACLLRLN